MLSDIALWTIDIIEKAGYVGLACLVAIENVFPPIPSEVVLPMAGFLTGQDRLNFVLAVTAATVGSTAGALLLYELGRRMGERRVRNFISRHGRWALLTGCDYDKAATWFDRHSDKAVLIGRFAPGVRSFISIPAGVQRMPVRKFMVFTTLGSAVYNSVLIGLGWFLGHNWEKVSEYTGLVETVLWIALGLVIGYWVYRRKFSSKAQSRRTADAGCDN